MKLAEQWGIGHIIISLSRSEFTVLLISSSQCQGEITSVLPAAALLLVSNLMLLLFILLTSTPKFLRLTDFPSFFSAEEVARAKNNEKE